MGTGCARGFLAAFDTAWMVRGLVQGKNPLETLAERCVHVPLSVTRVVCTLSYSFSLDSLYLHF